MDAWNGLEMNLGNLPRLSRAVSRSISAENPTGGKGLGAMAEAGPESAARDLGKGWKCSPSISNFSPGQTVTLADIEGPGAIQSMWFGGTADRSMILRAYWDGAESPSVEVPLNDFFANPWVKEGQTGTNGPYAHVNSMPVCLNPNRGMNCFWLMPFRDHCLITIQNVHPTNNATSYYQINYTLTDVPDDCAYFHAQFRRTNPLLYKTPYTILDGISGQGHYVGTAMGWGINNEGWWGEGEIKFYLDGDGEYPTICGTGTEDYFGGSYNWDVEGQYTEYSTPFMGMHQVLKPDGTYSSQHRHAMYRWHIMDPIRFEDEVRVTIQALGWRQGGRFYPGQHDICSVAYWYQTLPTGKFPKLPDYDGLEII